MNADDILSMSADDVTKIREKLGLTHTQLGEWLLLSGNQPGHTVRAWERGTNRIPGPVRICLDQFKRGLRPKHVEALKKEGKE